MRDSTDVFVIGGGPAGLAAAIAARQQGFRVVVADSAKPPIDKACGEALMPDAVAALEKLGVSVSAGESCPMRGVRFLSKGMEAAAEFPPDFRAFSVRRIVLHRALIERAENMGVDLLWQSVVKGITGEAVELGEGAIGARWIVGADGFSSRVRRWAQLESRKAAGARYSFRRHYRVAPWTDCMEIYWGKKSQGFVTGVNSEEVCVAVASRNPALRLEESLRDLPELGARLRGAEMSSTERGARSANRTLKRVWRGKVALIGDASGTVDAITGEGLGLSFNQAIVLAESLKSGNLAVYQKAHQSLMLRPFWMARLMLTLEGRPWFQRHVLHAFGKRPEIFRKVLALHVGALSPMDLARDGLTLGWGLLSA